MRPADVNSGNIMTVWCNLYDRKRDRQDVSEPAKLNVGDHVRITKYKHVFQKGYETNWSDEIFIIESVIKRSPRVVYALKDLEGESITGTFYSKELQKVTYHPSMKYKIDKILRSRRIGGRKEVLVKWKGYPNKFNSWIPASNLEKI